MIYSVNYMYVYDDYKDAGASTTVLGLFTSEEAAYKCAVQKYCEEILDHVEDKSELEERLLGTPKEMFEILDDWRDSLFEPEFTRDRVGPMVSVDSQETQSEWDLNGYFESASLTAGGMIAEILGSLTLTSTKKVGSKGIKELIAQVPDDVSMEDAERVLSSVEVTSSAQTQWDGYVAQRERLEAEREAERQRVKAEIEVERQRVKAEIEIERQRVVAEERAERDRLFEGSLREFGSGASKHAMMLIPKGEFMMGALEDDSQARNDEKPRHRVTLTRDFLIGKYAVTQALWESVMGSNSSRYKGANRPVECVSWFDVVAFCNKLSQREGLEPVYSGLGGYQPGHKFGDRDRDDWFGVSEKATALSKKISVSATANGYRLPTEAEWEYSARGGEYHKYSGSDNDGEVAWYDGYSGSETHPVGQKKPNGFGLYDMSGNVWEWVWDWKGGYSHGPVTDPYGPAVGSNRVQRGGVWYIYPEGVRASIRASSSSTNRYKRLGFRIVRSL